MNNHKTEYKYNYEELRRSIVSVREHLKLIAPELEENKKLFIEHLIINIDSTLKETIRNLKLTNNV